MVTRRVDFGFIGIVRRSAQERGGHQEVDHFRGEFGGVPPFAHLIAGELLGKESVERLVVVQGPDDPVAIAPLAGGQLDGAGVVVDAAHVDVAGGIQPVPCPALTEVRRSEEAVDQPLPGPRGLVFQELPQHFPGRRQTGEAKGDAPGQHRAGRARGEGESPGLELREDEGIHRGIHLAPGFRHARVAQRLPRPVLAVVLRDQPGRSEHLGVVARGQPVLLCQTPADFALFALTQHAVEDENLREVATIVGIGPVVVEVLPEGETHGPRKAFELSPREFPATIELAVQELLPALPAGVDHFQQVWTAIPRRRGGLALVAVGDAEPVAPVLLIPDPEPATLILARPQVDQARIWTAGIHDGPHHKDDMKGGVSCFQSGQRGPAQRIVACESHSRPRSDRRLQHRGSMRGLILHKVVATSAPVLPPGHRALFQVTRVQPQDRAVRHSPHRRCGCKHEIDHMPIHPAGRVEMPLPDVNREGTGCFGPRPRPLIS